MVEKWLDELGVSYISEWEFFPFRADIYLPEWHGVIEVDGPYHFSKADKKKDDYFWSVGKIPVIRLHYRVTKPHFIEGLEYWLDKWAEDAEERKKWWQTILLDA